MRLALAGVITGFLFGGLLTFTLDAVASNGKVDWETRTWVLGGALIFTTGLLTSILIFCGKAVSKKLDAIPKLSERVASLETSVKDMKRTLQTQRSN